MEHKNLQQHNPYNNNNKSNGYIVIPYTQSLCKSIGNICGKYGKQANIKGNRTFKKILITPKDKGHYITKK